MYSIGSKHIKVFLEAARTLSFTEAAQRLYTTQPSVSRIIRQMEEEIGVALFYRSRFSLSLTPAGEFLLKEFEHIQGQLYQALMQAREIGQPVQAGVRVGLYSYALLEEIYEGYFRAFEEAHPDLRLSYSFSGLAGEQLKTEDLDAIIIPDIQFSQREQYDSMALMESPLILVCAPENPIAVRGHITGEDFQSQTILTVFPAHMFQSFQEQTLRYYNTAAPKLLQVRNTEDLFLRLRAGNCFTLLDAYCATFNTDRLYSQSLPKGCSRVVFRFFWRKDNQNPALHTLLEFLRQRLVPGQEFPCRQQPEQ